MDYCGNSEEGLSQDRKRQNLKYEPDHPEWKGALQIEKR